MQQYQNSYPKTMEGGQNFDNDEGEEMNLNWDGGSQGDTSSQNGSYSQNGDRPHGVKIPGKRRSKNDNWGRDFNCKYCDKQYLSYPALYTHIKQKHSRGPNGQVVSLPTSGRGRGRPKKAG